jgi:ribonuclease HII
MRHERELRRAGFQRVAGLDEVGRGSLAGPVVAAAVILPDRHRIRGLRDSKVLGRSRREALYELILNRADAVAVGCIEVEVIDAINILQATKLAMGQALARIAEPPDHLVIDALTLRDVALPQRAIIDGDAQSCSIAAASIVAKVTRDREMLAYHAADPRYGYDHHKGYATAEHLAAVARFGYSALHRRSFRPPSLFDTL